MTREQEPDSNIVVRRIGQMRRVLAAAPNAEVSAPASVRPRKLTIGTGQVF